MINVALLRPSDIERLGAGELSAQDKTSILASLSAMLRDIRVDGGADSDRIFLSAQSLDMAGAWEQIPAEDLAAALSRAPHEARKIFLEGLPHRYAADVSLAILTKVPDDTSPAPFRQQVALEFESALEGIIRAVGAAGGPRLAADRDPLAASGGQIVSRLAAGRRQLGEAE